MPAILDSISELLKLKAEMPEEASLSISPQMRDLLAMNAKREIEKGPGSFLGMRIEVNDLLPPDGWMALDSEGVPLSINGLPISPECREIWKAMRG